MTAYELIGKLSHYPPDTKVYIIPQKRGKWSKRDRQVAEYVFDRGFHSMGIHEEPELAAIEITGVVNEIV